jgi:hypothetical protein
MSAEVALLVAHAGAHRVALRATEVDEIAPRSLIGATPLEVPALLGLTSEGDRLVRISGSAGWLCLGRELGLVRVPAAAFVPLPVWLPHAALPLSAAVAMDGAFAWVLDADRLAARMDAG